MAEVTPEIPEDPAPIFLYRTSVQFDPDETNTQHKEWCQLMFEHIAAIANGESIDMLLVETLEGSNNSISILFRDDLNHEVKVARLRDISNKVLFAALHGPDTLPNPWRFKHRG